MRIEIDRAEPECVKWVARHVREDLSRLPAATRQGLPGRIVAGTRHPMVQRVLAHHPDLPAFEGFVIERVPDASSTLVVASSHFRGTMFGLLEISRQLGVDPLQYFTDTPPATSRHRLALPIISAAPAFKYRGWFINEEDLLAAWKGPRPIPFSVFDNIFLTILRLGGNMVLPGTYLAPDSPVLDLAARRGLVLAQHHFQILGADVGRLTPAQKEKYSFVRFPEETIRCWRQAVRMNRHRETVWTLGCRGLNDEPFWHAEPSRFTDRQMGAVISRAIRAQLELLRDELGSAEVPCVYYLYRENQILFQKGFIRVPKGVSIVWCDNGYGTMESYYRNGYELYGDMYKGAPAPSKGKFMPAWPLKRSPGSGMYYHVAFYDSGAPNRVQYVPPAKIQRNLTRALRLGLDRFFLLNVGNVREVVLGVAAAFDFARSPRKWMADRLHHRNLLEEWCSRHVEPRYARQAADAYQRLYDAHWWWSTDPDKCFGDNAVRWLMQDLLRQGERLSIVSRQHMPGRTVPECMEIISREGEASLARWRKAVTAATRLEKRLRGDGRRFFHENVVVQAKRGRGAIETLLLSVQAVKAMERGDCATCVKLLGRAERALAQWEEALSAADRPPKWRRWSAGDMIVRTTIVRDFLQALRPMAMGVLGQSRDAIRAPLKRATRGASG